LDVGILEHIKETISADSDMNLTKLFPTLYADLKERRIQSTGQKDKTPEEQVPLGFFVLASMCFREIPVGFETAESEDLTKFWELLLFDTNFGSCFHGLAEILFGRSQFEVSFCDSK